MTNPPFASTATLASRWKFVVYEFTRNSTPAAAWLQTVTGAAAKRTAPARRLLIVSSLRPDQPLPPRFELVEEERAARSGLDAERAHAHEVHGQRVVVQEGQDRDRAGVDSQRERSVARPGGAGPLPVELEEMRPVADGEEPGVGPGAVVAAYPALDAEGAELPLQHERDYPESGAVRGDEDAGAEVRLGLAGIEAVGVEVEPGAVAALGVG